MALLFIAPLLILIGFWYIWTKRRYSYWSSRGITGPKPFPIVGNFGTVVAAKEHHDSLFQRIYNDYPNTAFVGIYEASTPTLMVRDPEMIKRILTKDFCVFRNKNLKGAYPMNDHAYSTNGDSWKVLRTLLSQAFTSGKLKNRLPLFAQCADEFLKYVDDSLAKVSDYEMQYDLMWRYNLHITGASLFGFDLKALSNDKNDLKHILDEFFNPGLHSRIILFVDQIIPGFQKLVSTLKLDPRMNKLSEFFIRFVNNVIETRYGQPAGFNDFTDQMIDQKKLKVLVKQGKRIELERSDMVLVNQFVLSYAGHVDSVTSFMSFFMHELAFNEEIQDRLLREIVEVTKNQNGTITYESLNDMVYLEMVLNEVLRLYSTAFIQRQAVSDYEFPGTKLKIEKGTIVIVPVLGLHKDPKYFEDPEVFDPERFSPQNIKNITDCTFLPFGDGPRTCIGMRSAKLQLKYGIAAFLQRFKLEPCERSARELLFYPTARTLTKTKGIWLKVSKRFVNTQHN